MNGDKSSVLLEDVNRKIVKLSPRLKKNQAVNILDIDFHPQYIATF